MKTLILFLFLSLCLFAGEDVAVTTVVKTNLNRVITKQYFTRNGQTNLMTSTTTTNDVVRSRLHRFYHNGKNVADHLAMPAVGYSSISTRGGYSLEFNSLTNTLTEVYLGDKDGNLIGVFAGTNGMLVPIPKTDLRGFTGILAPEKQESVKEKDK